MLPTRNRLPCLREASVGTNEPSSTGVVNPFTHLSGNLTGGVTLSWNIFNMFQTYTSTLDAAYQLTLREEEERRVARVVETELRVARAKVAHLSGRRAALTEAREVAKDNLQILRMRYQNGDAMVVEYLDSEVELADAELQLVGVTIELQIGWMELNLAAGVSACDSWETIVQAPSTHRPPPVAAGSTE